MKSKNPSASFLSFGPQSWNHLSVALALVLATLVGLAAPVAAQKAPAQPVVSTFFYASGKKQILPASSRWVGVELKPDASADTVASKGKTRTAIDPKRSPVRYNRKRILVFPVEPGATLATRQQLRTQLKGLNGVRREVRVFGNGRNPIVETDEFLIRFRLGVTQAKAARLLQTYGAALVKPLGRYASNGFVARVANPDQRSSIAVANALYHQPEVVFSYPNLIWPKQLRFTPNDPMYPQQWHLNNTGQGGGTAGADLKAAATWDITRGSPDVVIAVSDDGVDLEHEDLNGPNKFVPGRDFAGNDDDPSPEDGDFHGTAVAGVAAAIGNNGIGVSGVAPESRIMPIRLIAAGATLQDEAESFRFAADQGASVINCSWGPPDGTGDTDLLPDATRAAIDYAVTSGRGGKGCVILWAAGNGNESADLDGYSSYEKVISVAASTNEDRRAPYSDFGTSVDIAAPSNGGTLGITTTDIMGSDGYSNTNYTSTFGGTSSATPAAAGVVALILAVDPSLTYIQVRELLQNTADKIDPANGDYKPNGHSDFYGFGRINALRALQALSTTPTPTPTPAPTISGRITNSSGSPVAGVTVRASNTTSTAVTSATGTYTIPNVPAGTVVVTPSRSGYTFIPRSRTVTVNGSVTGVDFIAEAIPNVTLLAPASNSSVSGNYPLRASTQNNAIVQQMEFARRSSTNFTRTSNLPIADHSTTIDTQTLTASGTISGAALTVNINHTYIGDLSIVLIASDGTRLTVYNREGGGLDNLNHTFENLPLSGRSMAGTWRLEVRDHAAQDTGTLVSWTLRLATAWVLIATDSNGPTNGEWTATWNTSTTPPGVYDVRALARTSLGNFVDINSNVRVTTATTDTTAPSASVSSPANNASLRTLSSVSGSGSDNVGVSRVNLYLRRMRDGAWQYWGYSGTRWEWSTTVRFFGATLSNPNGTNTNWTRSSNLPTGANLPSGTYYVFARAFDKAGNSGVSAIRTIIVDVAAPVSVTILNPANGSTLSTLSSLSGSASDNTGGSGISRVNLYLRRMRDGAWQYWGYSGTRWEWSTTVRFFGATLSNPNGTNTNWTRSSNLPSDTNLPSGTYYVFARAFDRTGNSTTSAIHTVSVQAGVSSAATGDTTAPTSVTIFNPANGSTLSTLSSVSGSASDNTGGSGIKRVNLYLRRMRDGAWQYWGYSGTRWEWSTTVRFFGATLSNPNGINTNWTRSSNLPTGANLPSGTYYVFARAFDRTGRATDSAVHTVSIQR